MVGQSTDPLYLWHDYVFEDLYIVSTIEVHPDLSYTRRIWSFEDQKDWPTYKDIEPDIKNGRMDKKGSYYFMTEDKDGKEELFESRIKLSKRRLLMYYPNENGLLVLQAIYKKIN